MRLIIAGSDDFAVPSFQAVVAAGHQVPAVLTVPDRPGDRGRPAPRPLRDAAAAAGILVLQPLRLGDPEAVRELEAVGADALVVAAYGQLVPMRLLERLTHGGLGVHPSLLPRHRGATPIQAAILAGDRETGVSLMRMAAGLDTGPVLGQVRLPLPDRATTPELRSTLARAGAALLVEVVDQLARGAATPTVQDAAMATYAPTLRRADGALDWDRPPIQIDRRLRALQPWPGVTVPLGGQRVRLLEGRPEPGPAGAAGGPPGTVLRVDGESALVRSGAGVFRCDRVQPPSGRPMGAGSYLRGRRPPSAGAGL